MAIFSAPAWMMKGKNKGFIGNLITEEAFINGLEKVNGEAGTGVGGVWRSQSLTLEFSITITGEGFKDQKNNVQVYIGAKRYNASSGEDRMPGLYTTGKTIDTTNPGRYKFTFKKSDFTNASVLSDLQHPYRVYLAFRTSTMYLSHGRTSPYWEINVDNN